ncbi:MAG: YkgJ family cysteine cluster protein [Desulfurococcaceae archaeon]
MNNPIVKRGEKVRFACQRSGKCCSSGPNVSLTAFDICRISKFLGVNWTDLVGDKIYAVIADYFAIPVLRGRNGRCVFLTRDKEGRPACSIYPARPMRCRLYPFIPVSPGNPNVLEISMNCPGVGKGPMIDPPWRLLERYYEEVRLHYELLHKLVFEEGLSPIEALERAVDMACKGWPRADLLDLDELEALENT